MDTHLAQLLGPVRFNENFTDITSKTDLNMVVVEAGTRPDLEPWLYLMLIIFAGVTINAMIKGGLPSKISKIVYVISCIAVLVLEYHSFGWNGISSRTPENDLYAVTVVSEEKENVWLMDGLYELKEVKEEGSAYVVEIPNGDEKPQQVFLPKAQYHFEKVIDVETDTLAELQKELSEPEKS